MTDKSKLLYKKYFNISFIIVCYNNKNELISTILSIINNNSFLKQAELLQLIIIDGSTKRLLSEKECIYLIDNKIDYEYHNQSDKGPYSGMNIGLSFAKGKWIWFLNSGDLLVNFPDYSDLQTNKNLLIGKWYASKNNHLKIMEPIKRGLEHNFLKTYGNGLCHQAMLFKKKKLIKPFYDFEQFKFAAELDFYIDFLILKDYTLSKKIFAKYDSGKGISKENSIKHLIDQKQIFRKRGLPILGIYFLIFKSILKKIITKLSP